MHVMGLFTLSLNNLLPRMKNKRHAKAFQCLFFGNLSALTFILTKVSNKPMVFALIWHEFVFEIK